MIELIGSEQQRQFGLDKRDTLPQFCVECDVRFACHGGCPKDRFIETPDGEPGLNYLCAGYKAFFHHVDRPMRLMSERLRHGGPPSEIMAPLRGRGCAARAQRPLHLRVRPEVEAAATAVSGRAPGGLRPRRRRRPAPRRGRRRARARAPSS